jgi:hypothetical protein
VMRWIASPPPAAVEVRLTELTAAVKSVEAQLVAHQAVADEVTRGQLAQLQSLDRRVGEVKDSVDQVSERAETHLDGHVHAKNPHPEMEEWMGARFTNLGSEINALAKQQAQWQGSLRIVAFVGAPVVGIVSGLVVKMFGG